MFLRLTADELRPMEKRSWKRHLRSKADTSLFKLSRDLVALRVRAGRTQAEVAKAMRTQKSAVSRLERGDGPPRPTFTTIENYAWVLGYRVEVRFLRRP